MTLISEADGSTQLWWPFSFFIANKILVGLVKQKKSTAVLSVRILIRMPNQALSDVTQFKKKESTFVISCVITEHIMPNNEAPSTGTPEMIHCRKV